MGRVTILSESIEPFRDRKAAGALLGAALKHLHSDHTVVLGIPRGGVVVAKEAADVLKAGLDIVLSRKIGAPHNPELAIGAISEKGEIFLDRDIAAHTGAGEAYIKEEAKRQSAEIKRRSEMFRKILPKISLKNKIVIITDDGLATGATMQVSLWAAAQEKPEKLIAAVPVASREAIDRIAKSCDEVICLRLPSFFSAVGQFYLNFDQTTDKEVLAILSTPGVNPRG